MRTIRSSLFVLWIASLTVVAFFSLQPGTGVPPLFPGADKVAHILAYCWLAALALRVFLLRGPAFTAAWSMILYGAALEVGQRFVPGRHPSLGDILANMLGVALGVFIGHRMKIREHDKKMDALLGERSRR